MKSVSYVLNIQWAMPKYTRAEVKFVLATALQEEHLGDGERVH